MNPVTHEWPQRELEEAVTLPSRYYYDPAIMQEEKWKFVQFTTTKNDSVSVFSYSCVDVKNANLTSPPASTKQW